MVNGEWGSGRVTGWVKGRVRNGRMGARIPLRHRRRFACLASNGRLRSVPSALPKIARSSRAKQPASLSAQIHSNSLDQLEPVDAFVDFLAHDLQLGRQLGVGSGPTRGAV